MVKPEMHRIGSIARVEGHVHCIGCWYHLFTWLHKYEFPMIYSQYAWMQWNEINEYEFPVVHWLQEDLFLIWRVFKRCGKGWTSRYSSVSCNCDILEGFNVYMDFKTTELVWLTIDVGMWLQYNVKYSLRW